MVHALHEAHRVLQPDGLLVDLRPGPVHRRVGIERQGRFELLGVMREKLDDDRAANRAVAQVLQAGLFKAEWRAQFVCNRALDSLDDLRAFVDEMVRLADLPSHDWLIERVQRALHAARGKHKILVTGPLGIKVLRKLDGG